MKEALILKSECEVTLLRECATWFLETQDPEFDDAVYDGNDRIILQDILLPRISHPLDVNAGTCKDLGLLTQCLETALIEGFVTGEKVVDLLQRLKDYAKRERRRLGARTL